MPAADGLHSTAATVKYDTVGASTFANGLGGVQSVTVGGRTCKISDATSLADAAKRIIAGKIANEPVTLNILFRKAEYAIANGFIGVLKNWQIMVNDHVSAGSKLVFLGIPNNIGLAIPDDDTITYPYSIAIDGDVTFTAGS